MEEKLISQFELVNFSGKDNMYFNDNKTQKYKDLPSCGYLCVYVYANISKIFYLN